MSISFLQLQNTRGQPSSVGRRESKQGRKIPVPNNVMKSCKIAVKSIRTELCSEPGEYTGHDFYIHIKERLKVKLSIEVDVEHFFIVIRVVVVNVEQFLQH